MLAPGHGCDIIRALTTEDYCSGYGVGRPLLIFVRTVKNPKGAEIGRDGQASNEWKAGTTRRRTHLQLGFGQNLRARTPLGRNHIRMLRRPA